ncbi:hypothetical protein ABZT03_44270 [Streptomyces sp. NPDC005574]
MTTTENPGTPPPQREVEKDSVLTLLVIDECDFFAKLRGAKRPGRLSTT